MHVGPWFLSGGGSMSLMKQFVKEVDKGKGRAKRSQDAWPRVQRWLGGQQFLGMPGYQAWTEETEGAPGKRTPLLFPISDGMEGMQAELRAIAARMQDPAEPFKAILDRTAALFEPTDAGPADPFTGFMKDFPDDPEANPGRLPKEAIDALRRIGALPALCRLINVEGDTVVGTGQVHTLLELLLPDAERRSTAFALLAKELWQEPENLSEAQTQATWLEVLLWRLAELQYLIKKEAVLGKNFVFPPFTAAQPLAPSPSIKSASMASLSALRKDQAAIKKRRDEEKKRDADPKRVRRSASAGSSRRSPPRQHTPPPKRAWDAEGSSSSSSEEDPEESPGPARKPAAKASAQPPLPQETPEAVRQQRRGVMGGFGIPYASQAYHAELEKDMAKDPGTDKLGEPFQRTRAELLTVKAFAQMHDGKLFGPPILGKHGGEFDLAKVWREGRLRLVRHSFYNNDNNKGCRASSQSLGWFFESFDALVPNLNQLSSRIRYLAEERNEAGQPTYGYLAGKAIEETARITSFIAVLNQLKLQYNNESQLMAYAASAIYLHFASGRPAWLEQPDPTLWEKLTPYVGLHCTTCDGLGHLSGGHDKVISHCAIKKVPITDACQFPPHKVATLPAAPKNERNERQASPYRNDSNSSRGRSSYQQDNYRSNYHGGGYQGGGGRDRRDDRRDRGDNRDGNRQGNRYAPPGQQQRQGGRGRQGGDRARNPGP